MELNIYQTNYQYYTLLTSVIIKRICFLDVSENLPTALFYQTGANITYNYSN